MRTSAGVGDGNTGVWITPQMTSLLHPLQNCATAVLFECLLHRTGGKGGRRLRNPSAAVASMSFRPGAKVMLLAFDFHYDEQGERQEDLSAFFIPNRYAATLAQRFPNSLEWICSVHPYRPDAIDELHWSAGQRARAVKWLPSAMGMDPASPKCDRFYQALVSLNLPLLTHSRRGEGGPWGFTVGTFNNPLRFRRPLDQGVRVIIAHCASLGEDIDIDRGPNGPRVEVFELFPAPDG